MKKYLFFPVALLCLLATPANAQKDSSGVYMSAADFTNGKPQYAIIVSVEWFRMFRVV